jgi:hypothetical protein
MLDRYKQLGKRGGRERGALEVAAWGDRQRSAASKGKARAAIASPKHSNPPSTFRRHCPNVYIPG